MAGAGTLSPTNTRDIHLSIVSHGHGTMLRSLMLDLVQHEAVERLQLTLVYNIPELPIVPDDLPFPVRIVENTKPLGFADNHNRAFASAPDAGSRSVFVVMNPDVRLCNAVLATLADTLLADANCGVIAPKVVDGRGQLQQTARPLPHFWNTVLRFAGGSTNQSTAPVSHRPDWVAGMLMMFPAALYMRLGGFDTRYRLYYEDVDMCCRVWQAGKQVRLCETVHIVHDGQWQSRHRWQHMRWHISSALKFFLSASYRHACRRQHEQVAA